MRFLIVLVLGMGCSACATSLESRVSGNLNKLSPLQTVAILPVGVNSNRQLKMAQMLRRNLYAQLKPSKFSLLEPYVVDGLLKRNSLMVPAEYAQLDPMKFGEVLGVDAVLISKVNKIEKSYYLIHSSIELSVSVQMIDTRSGEILWQAEQTEIDIQGILKIPTGITAAVIAPIYLMVNKLKIREMTSTMVSKLTSIVRHPNEANDGKIFDGTGDRQRMEQQRKRIRNTNRFQQTAGSAKRLGGAPDSTNGSGLKACECGKRTRLGTQAVGHHR